MSGADLGCSAVARIVFVLNTVEWVLFILLHPDGYWMDFFKNTYRCLANIVSIPRSTSLSQCPVSIPRFNTSACLECPILHHPCVCSRPLLGVLLCVIF
eukprot:2514729-Rhodomonas_salina.2